MSAPYDPRPALLAIPTRRIEGAPGPWWPLREVCDALRIADQAAASRLIPAEHKRRVIEGRGRYNKHALALIDLAGLERLCIRYAAIPRHQIMAALAAAT